MTLTGQNFVMYQGNDAVLKIHVEEDGEDKDLTSATITWGCALSATSPALLTKTNGSGVTITDADGGDFEVTIDAADTTAMSGEYYHEAKVVDSGSNLATVLTGTLTIEPALLS